MLPAVVPPSDPDRLVLYNRTVDGHYGAVVQDVEPGMVVRHYRRPIYAVSPDGKWAISLNFSRIQRLRPGYGYAVLPDETADDPLPSQDGLWRVNMGTLYPGRGIDIIRGLAERMAERRFHVIGPLASLSEDGWNFPSNLVFYDALAPAQAQHLCGLFDALLMPYQEKVRIQTGLDTRAWMSPMKMFENE